MGILKLKGKYTLPEINIILRLNNLADTTRITEENIRGILPPNYSRGDNNRRFGRDIAEFIGIECNTNNGDSEVELEDRVVPLINLDDAQKAKFSSLTGLIYHCLKTTKMTAKEIKRELKSKCEALVFTHSKPGIQVYLKGKIIYFEKEEIASLISSAKLSSSKTESKFKSAGYICNFLNQNYGFRFRVGRRSVEAAYENFKKLSLEAGKSVQIRNHVDNFIGYNIDLIQAIVPLIHEQQKTRRDRIRRNHPRTYERFR